MSNRNHPIRQLLSYAAMGESPSAEALDKVAKIAGDKFPGVTLRKMVKQAAERIVAIRNEGEMGRARRNAREAAAQIIGGAGLEDYTSPSRDLPDSPRELAALARGETVTDGENPRDLAAKVSRDFIW